MDNKPFKFTVKVRDESKTWHDSIEILLERNEKQVIVFTLKETIMGCGIAQLSGVAYLYVLTEEELNELKDILQNKITKLTNFGISQYKCFKVGYLICTLGENFRKNNTYDKSSKYEDNEPYLYKLGFKELSEYSNWRHRELGNEIQKLYGLHTNYNGIENLGKK